MALLANETAFSQPPNPVLIASCSPCSFGETLTVSGSGFKNQPITVNYSFHATDGTRLLLGQFVVPSDNGAFVATIGSENVTGNFYVYAVEYAPGGNIQRISDPLSVLVQ